MPAGTTAFPDPTKKACVALYDSYDSKKEWGAGSTGAPGSGTAMRDADLKSGSIDLDMTDASPPGSRPCAAARVGHLDLLSVRP